MSIRFRAGKVFVDELRDEQGPPRCLCGTSASYINYSTSCELLAYLGSDPVCLDQLAHARMNRWLDRTIAVIVHD